MDENTKKVQREIAKDKIQIILSGIAVAVLIVMEFYIMINYKSNFMLMAVGILLLIFALFFLISAMLDMSLKTKDIEEQKYEDIYNAQKASYLVIKKSFDELEQRLRNIEESSFLPAEDIINAQKAVAKVTISRSKENTDALMNSNDELISQLFAIKEKLDANNTQIIEKQQALLKESNFDLQQKIAELTSQISSIEGRIQNGIPVMAQPMQMQMPPPVQMVPPVYEAPQTPAPAPEPVAQPEPVAEMPVMEETPVMEEMPVMEEAPVMEEMPAVEEVQASEETPSENIGIDLDMAVAEEAVPEEPSEDLGIDLGVAVEAAEETSSEEVVDDLGLDLDMAIAEEPVAEEAVAEETPAEEISLEGMSTEESPSEEVSLEEAPVEEAPAEELILETTPVEEAPTEEIILETTPVEEAPAEEIILESAPQETDPGAGLDALLEEVGEIPNEEPPAEESTAPEPEAPPEEKEPEEIVIPDVGVDLTDPNRVMSAEEIEKLFASI